MERLALSYRQVIIWSSLLFILWGILVWLQRSPSPSFRLQCTDLISGCQLPEQQGVLRFSSIPVAMQPFMIHIEGNDSQQAEVHFSMENMDMGFHQYKLKSVSAHRLQGVATLPVCARGQRKWLMLIKLDRGGTVEVAFSSR